MTSTDITMMAKTTSKQLFRYDWRVGQWYEFSVFRSVIGNGNIHIRRYIENPRAEQSGTGRRGVFVYKGSVHDMQSHCRMQSRHFS